MYTLAEFSMPELSSSESALVALVTCVCVVLILLHVNGWFQLNSLALKSAFTGVPEYHASHVAGIHQRWYGGSRTDPGAETEVIGDGPCPNSHSRVEDVSLLSDPAAVADLMDKKDGFEYGRDAKKSGFTDSRLMAAVNGQ